MGQLGLQVLWAQANRVQRRRRTEGITRGGTYPARKLRAGSVWVNYWDGGDMTAPFGGYKQSGNGRDKSLHAFDKYTEIKATWINLGS